MTEIKAVVVTDTCPHCATLKDALAKSGVLDKVKIINASTPEGLEFAHKHNIMAVPECVIITDDNEVRSCNIKEFEKLLKEGQ